MIRDNHVRVLPLHVANKIAAGEVVERPASVVKELLENAIDAGATNISISITQGGRKLVAVQDNGIGMSKDDAVLSLERQATSKIHDVDDIENIDTLGFRGEAIPSIASVSRFSITTRRHDSDEGTRVIVNAGTLAEVCSAGCPPGTLVEVRDLFCNVPARRKFLRSYQTEENHIKQIFTVHALAHPKVGFSLTIDGRESCRLAAAGSLCDRVVDLFGSEFVENLLVLDSNSGSVAVTGFIEKPNLSAPTRQEQYIFINGRPATSASIQYALKEAYPRRPGDVRPAAVIFLTLPPNQVDVNVHPTKREVRFRNNVDVKQAISDAISSALSSGRGVIPEPPASTPDPQPNTQLDTQLNTQPVEAPSVVTEPVTRPTEPETILLVPQPTESELPLGVDDNRAKPWKYFRYLAQSASGYLLIETDSGLVTINPIAARERIAYEKMLSSEIPSQTLLIPETARLSPVDFSRINQALDVIRAMGFQLEEFGDNTFKIDAVPQLAGSLSPSALLSTIAHDLSECGSRKGGERWREELIAKSISRSFAGSEIHLNEAEATKLVEDLCQTRMPYICPRGKPVMTFTSTRELDRKFGRI